MTEVHGVERMGHLTVHILVLDRVTGNAGMPSLTSCLGVSFAFATYVVVRPLP